MELRKIESFKVNHVTLSHGLYVSREDGDCITYDLRFKRPNGGDYLENGTIHTLEHLMATYMRSSAISGNVVYVGPMGCRTGFYVIVRDVVGKNEVLNTLADCMEFVSSYDGEIPGVSEIECGNFMEHNLHGARMEASAMLETLRTWIAESMSYDRVIR